MHKNCIVVKSFNCIMEVTNIVDIMSEYNIFSSADRKLELLEFYQGIVTNYYSNHLDYCICALVSLFDVFTAVGTTMAHF